MVSILKLCLTAAVLKIEMDNKLNIRCSLFAFRLLESIQNDSVP